MGNPASGKGGELAAEARSSPAARSSGPGGYGAPGRGLSPYDWSIYEWLPGENANGTIRDLNQAAVDLAAFVKALRRVVTTGAHPRPPHSRGGPLAELDAHVRWSIEQLGSRIDGETVRRLWEESLSAPAWQGSEVWVHVYAVTDWVGVPTNRSPEEHAEIAWLTVSEACRLALADDSYPALFEVAMLTALGE